MSNDTTDPANYWPGEDAQGIPFNANTGWPDLVKAILAVAAELRTANHIAFLELQQKGSVSGATLAPIRERLGLSQ